MTSENIAVFAVSVHENFPILVAARLELLCKIGRHVSERIKPARRVVIFPGGYFGFDPVLFRADRSRAWPGFDDEGVRQALPTVLEAYPPETWLVFGADCPVSAGGYTQEAWVCRSIATGKAALQTIVRERTDLRDRIIEVGSLRMAVFVCGESTGSYTEANGPYCGNKYLRNPVSQLPSCNLLVDLAHSRVKKSINPPPQRRLVHERQMRQFAAQGAAVLTHHHPGYETVGRPRDNCKSDWIMFRGGRWLKSDQMQVVGGASV
jgi:hypothetical protein